MQFSVLAQLRRRHSQVKKNDDEKQALSLSLSLSLAV
jgi:hypothetical protein